MGDTIIFADIRMEQSIMDLVKAYLSGWLRTQVRFIK